MTDCTECGGKNKQSLAYEFYCRAVSKIAGGILTQTVKKKFTTITAIVTASGTIPDNAISYSVVNLTNTANWTFNGGAVHKDLVEFGNTGTPDGLSNAMAYDPNGNTLQITYSIFV